MNNSQRSEALERVLTKAFKPKFDAILEEVEVALRIYLNENHINFVNMLKDPEYAKYLAIGRVYKVELNENILCKPTYGRFSEIPTEGWWRCEFKKLKPDEVFCPTSMHVFKFEDSTLLELYQKYWSDYTKAYTELSALFNSYKTRAKLLVDFPEYAEFVPEPEGKKQLPVVIVSQVRAELSTLGVP